MRRGKMLNSEIISTIANMGHTDEITISDAGLPIPNTVKKIDLALKKGIPSFIDTLKTVKNELVIEKVIIANEIIDNNKEIYEKIINIFEGIEIELISHEEFKLATKKSKAVIRTGEFTPYANIILVAGVDFNGVDYE